MDEDLNLVERIAADYGLWAAYILFIAATGLILFFSIKSIVVNPKGSTKILISIGLLLGIFLISWLISPFDFKQEQYAHGITPTTSGLVGGALITVYILFGGAFASIVFFELKRLVKK